MCAKTNTNYQRFLGKEKNEQDWVVAGVIVSKVIRTSSGGNQFCVWTLSDLQRELKTVALFLFGDAFKQCWKNSAGTVVGVLNPSVFETKAAGKDEVRFISLMLR